MKKNPYVVLGVNRGADLQDIKQAYRRAVKCTHPDLSSDKNGQRFKEIQNAYDILKDRDKRRACDAKLEGQRPPESRRAGRPARGSAPPPIAADLGQPDLFDASLRSRRAHSDIYLEILLSPVEARNGGRFPIRLPLDQQCPECRGAFPWVMLCGNCRGSGRLHRVETFSLHIPAGIADGTCVRLPLEKYGALGAALYLQFRIDPRAG
jgi:DnaJ-class molecular chaperone